MKKTVALILTLILAIMLSPSAFADGNTTVTLEVPAPLEAEYTLTIPENQTLPYNSETFSYDIGTISVTESKNFAEDEYVEAFVSTNGIFSSETTAYKLNYKLRFSGHVVGQAQKTLDFIQVEEKSKPFIFANNGQGGVDKIATVHDGNDDVLIEHIFVDLGIFSSYRDIYLAAEPGSYTTVLTFTSSVKSTNN